MQKKSIQAVLVVVVLLFMCNVSMFAQESQKPRAAPSEFGTSNPFGNITDQNIELVRANFRATRSAITETYMPLTADEATKFWPIFDQYRAEAVKLFDERWALIKDYAANYNANAFTDSQAQDYVQKTTDVDQQLLALRMKYVPVFGKVISPKKTALWYQIDRRIDLLFNA